MLFCRLSRCRILCEKATFRFDIHKEVVLVIYSTIAPMARSFFIDGTDCERGYRNVRESKFLEPARNYTEKLWRVYEPYADRHFRHDAKKHFLQRYWEMYLTVALIESGVDPVRLNGTGPEFYFEHDGHRVWIEAIAPGPGQGKDRVPKDLSKHGFSVPTEKILLRYTSALTAKRDKLLIDRTRGIVKPQDGYILAINCRAIPHAWLGGVIPYAIQAFLPFGPLTLMFDIRTMHITERYFQRREAVSKQSGASVSTKAFLDPSFAGISAIIHSAVDAANAPVVLGADFFVLHNPLATVCVPINLFSHWKQFEFTNDQVTAIEPNHTVDPEVNKRR